MTTETEKDIIDENDDDKSTLSSPGALQLSYDLVPKHSELGSIWTPYNYAACIHTRNVWGVV